MPVQSSLLPARDDAFHEKAAWYCPPLAHHVSVPTAGDLFAFTAHKVPLVIRLLIKPLPNGRWSHTYEIGLPVCHYGHAGQS